MSLHQQNKADSDTVSERQPQLEDFAVCAETARANVWQALRAELKPPGLNVATGAAARITSGHQWAVPLNLCQWEKPPLARENGSRREQSEALIDFPSLSQVLQLPLIGIAQRSSHQL